MKIVVACGNPNFNSIFSRQILIPPTLPLSFLPGRRLRRSGCTISWPSLLLLLRLAVRSPSLSQSSGLCNGSRPSNSPSPLKLVTHTLATFKSKCLGILSSKLTPTLFTLSLSISFCGSTTSPLFVRTNSFKSITTVSHLPGCLVVKRC